jgi:hypothetical protein
MRQNDSVLNDTPSVRLNPVLSGTFQANDTKYSAVSMYIFVRSMNILHSGRVVESMTESLCGGVRAMIARTGSFNIGRQYQTSISVSLHHFPLRRLYLPYCYSLS